MIAKKTPRSFPSAQIQSLSGRLIPRPKAAAHGSISPRPCLCGRAAAEVRRLRAGDQWQGPRPQGPRQMSKESWGFSLILHDFQRQFFSASPWHPWLTAMQQGGDGQGLPPMPQNFVVWLMMLPSGGGSHVGAEATRPCTLRRWTATAPWSRSWSPQGPRWMLPIKMAVVGDSFVALATEVMEVPWHSDFSFCFGFLCVSCRAYSSKFPLCLTSCY